MRLYAEAQLKKLEAGLLASPFFYASRRVTATAGRPPRGIERKFGLRLRLTKRVSFAAAARLVLRVRRERL